MDLTIGSELPPFTRAASFDAWNRYAAVNDEFVPLHMDDEAGRAAGFPGAIGMGNLLLSYLHCLIRDAMPETARIRKVEVSYRQPSLRGGTVTASGTIAGVIDTADGKEIEIDLQVADAEGKALLSGRALVLQTSA